MPNYLGPKGRQVGGDARCASCCWPAGTSFANSFAGTDPTMNNAEEMQNRSAIRERGTRRCYRCNGLFGLIRHRFGLRQFCSTSCLIKYRAEIEQTTTRIKE